MFLKAAVAGHCGGLEGLNAGTGALSLSPALERLYIYTLRPMTSHGPKLIVLCSLASVLCLLASVLCLGEGGSGIEAFGGGNSGNLPYLVTNTYGLNCIKIGGI